MPLLRPRAVTLSGVLLFASAVALIAQPPHNSLTGHWTGTFDVVHPDGAVDPDQAFLDLTQTGTQLTGSAGASPNNLSPLTSGAVSGDAVNLTLTAHGRPVTLSLTRQGDHLRGAATGLPLDPGATVAIDLVPSDAAWHPASPVPHAPDRLAANIAAMDTKLFTAYNSCDLSTLSALVSEDLEFYHDKTGLAIGRQPFVDAIRDNICGKTQRTLVPGTLEVHRLENFGAVEMGVHRFSHPNHPEYDNGEAKFITIWRWKDNGWQMTRAISYDHTPDPAPSPSR